jgi:predicted sulfurtransferase
LFEWKIRFDFELVMTHAFVILGSDYEWDVGHFEGAERPNVDCFRSTSFGLSEEVIIPWL